LCALELVYLALITSSLLCRKKPLGTNSGAIFKTPDNGADIFANDSDTEATPKVKLSSLIFPVRRMDN
jgi:hypothetical protein